jgi:hypothetical protein
MDWEQVDGLFAEEFNLGTPLECDLYEVQVRTHCVGDTTEFTPIENFFSPNCPNCDTLDYCDVGNIDASFEWIDSIYFGEFINGSGSDGGYGDFTGAPFAFVLRGEEIDVRVAQAYDFSVFNEWFKIWIDFDQDGVFADTAELVFDTGAGLREPAEGVVQIPDNATLGNTRMRVAMKFVSDNDPDEPGPCGNFAGGEVEDYCIVILGDDDPCAEVPLITQTSAMGMTTTISWSTIDTAIAYNVRYRKLGESAFEEKATVDTFIVLEELETCSNYEVSVRTVCPFDTSQYSRSTIIETDCPNAVEEEEFVFDKTVDIFPNPFTQSFTIAWEQHERMDTRISVFDIQGRLIMDRDLGNLPAGNHQVIYDRGSTLSEGIYFVRLQSGFDAITKRVIKAGGL